MEIALVPVAKFRVAVNVALSRPSGVNIAIGYLGSGTPFVMNFGAFGRIVSSEILAVTVQAINSPHSDVQMTRIAQSCFVGIMLCSPLFLSVMLN